MFFLRKSLNVLEETLLFRTPVTPGGDRAVVDRRRRREITRA
jgi:hypothetical protein